MQGLLQRAPADLAAGQDFSQTLGFCEEAAQEAAAAARRRARRTAGHGGGGGGGGEAAGGGVAEWTATLERVVLWNDGQFVAAPEAAPPPLTARPVTALVAA